MMGSYEFTDAKIAHWYQKIGADVRPPIEIRLDEERFQAFSKWARKEHPQLFDRMVVGKQQFQMLKTLEYPGKPNADAVTYTMTERGPVIVVPRRISEIDLEPDLPEINEVFVDCMKHFLREFPGRRVIRVGKINEYIFDCGDTNSLELVAKNFSQIEVPDEGEISIRFNLPDDRHNRIFMIQHMEQKRVQPGQPMEHMGFGVKVVVDVNNRDVTKGMAEADWLTVLNTADIYNREDVFNVLNCRTEEEI